MTIGQFFRSAVYINLERRVDRRMETEAELARIGLRASRFTAIEVAEKGRFPNCGTRSCHLSHLAVLEAALRDGAERLLVMEDDVGFVSDAVSRIEVVLNDLVARPWDMFYLDVGGDKRIVERVSCSGLVRLSACLWTHSYVVNGSALPFIVEQLRKNSRRPIDRYYIRYLHPHLRVFGVTPRIAYQRCSTSDVTRPGELRRG